MQLRFAKADFVRTILLGVGLACLSVPGALVQAQPAQEADTSTFVYNPPAPPQGQGTPRGRQQGGASRGSCSDYAGLTALVPEHHGIVKGLTTAAKPTFLFYVPLALTPDQLVELVVQDQNDEYIAKDSFRLTTEAAGIVSLKLQQPLTPLNAGETYQWTLSIYCSPDQELPSVSNQELSSVYVQGLLDRVNDAASPAKQLSSFDQAAQYAEQGIWFESLALLAELRQAKPNDPDITQAWHDLLRQGELSSVAPATLLDSSNAKPHHGSSHRGSAAATAEL